MKGPNNWSWLRSANTGRALQNSCVVSWPISFRLHRVDIEQCLNEKKNYSFLAGCYQLCKSSNVCSHNTCLLILNGTPLGNSSPQLSLVLLTILFPQLWKNIDHGLSNGMAVCVERIVPLQELTRPTWPFPLIRALCTNIIASYLSDKAYNTFRHHANTRIRSWGWYSHHWTNNSFVSHSLGNKI